MLVYINIYLPKNLESFLNSLNVFSLLNYLPNIGQIYQYYGLLSTKDKKMTPKYFHETILD